MKSQGSAGTQTGDRIRYIDGLRGAAALGVACYHTTRYGDVAKAAREVIPSFLQTLFDHGWVGVQIFFMISGFVIAYTVRNARVTPGFVANYAFRRSLRLDPPYWATIALVLLIHAVLHLQWGMASPLNVPTPLQPELSGWLVLSHVLYIHKLLGYDSLSAGFWTLCIEVQFYLLYVISLGLIQLLARRASTGSEASKGAETWSPVGWRLTYWLGLIALLSLFLVNYERAWEDTLAFHFYLFFPGCVVCWILCGEVPLVAYWGYVVLAIIRLGMGDGFQSWDGMLELKAALLTSASILYLGLCNRLTSTLNWRWLQYLGRISYSFYLVHFPVAHVVCLLAEQMVGGTPSPPVALFVLVVAIACGIGIAHLFHRFIEAPSIRWAAYFRPGSAGAGSGALTSVAPVSSPTGTAQ